MPMLQPNATAKIHFSSLFSKIEDNKLKSNLKNISPVGVIWEESNSLWQMYRDGDLIINETYDETNNETIITVQNITDNITPRFMLPMHIDGVREGLGIVIYVNSLLNDTNIVDENNTEDFYYKDFKFLERNGCLETTSPGFLVEDGKIKCYRASDFSKVIDNIKWAPDAGRQKYSFKYIKDGTVFYYHKSNMEGGKSPKFVREQRAMFDAMTSISYTGHNVSDFYMRREDGVLEFVSPVLKPRFWAHKQSPYPGDKDGFICNIGARYLGVNESGNLVFEITKSESTSRVYIKSIAISCLTQDGTKKTLSSWLGSYLPAEGGSMEVVLGADDFEYPEGSIKVEKIGIRVDYDNEMYMMAAPGGSARSTRTRWHNMLSDIKEDWSTRIKYRSLRSRFIGHKFHRCRYIQKFKGVKSEFPELFYVR
jgi:hypothetical protein